MWGYGRVERHAELIRIRPDRLAEYKRCHAEIWPGVAKTIEDCNIRNYSIYERDGYLFAYYEYVGNDFEGDMQKMAADPETQRWWDYVKPMQEPLENRHPGEWWSAMQEVFHQP